MRVLLNFGNCFQFVLVVFWWNVGFVFFPHSLSLSSFHENNDEMNATFPLKPVIMKWQPFFFELMRFDCWLSFVCVFIKGISVLCTAFWLHWLSACQFTLLTKEHIPLNFVFFLSKHNIVCAQIWKMEHRIFLFVFFFKSLVVFEFLVDVSHLFYLMYSMERIFSVVLK